MTLIPLLRSKEKIAGYLQAELSFGLITGLNCLGYESFTIDDSAAVALPSVPTDTINVVMVVEADDTLSATEKQMVVRFREDAIDPTPTEGMPLGHLSLYTVGGVQNIDNIRMIGIQAGKTHNIRLSYYG